MPVIVRQRRDTTVKWSAVNPVIPDGQLAFDTSNLTFRIGNGVDNYLDLPTIGGEGDTEQNKVIVYSTDNLTSAEIATIITNNDAVEFVGLTSIQTPIILNGLSDKMIQSHNGGIFIDRHGYSAFELTNCHDITFTGITCRGYGVFPDRLEPFGIPLNSPYRGMGEKGLYPDYMEYRNGDNTLGGPTFGNGVGGTAGTGLMFNSCSKVIVSNCDIYGFNGDGIALGDTTVAYSLQTKNTDFTISANRIRECYTSGITGTYFENTAISGNNVFDIGHPDAQTGDDKFNPGYGVSIGHFGSGDSTSSDISIYGNIITDIVRKAIDLHSGERISIVSNVCTTARNSGISLAGNDPLYPRDVTISANSLYKCGQEATYPEEAYGVQLAGGANAVLSDNIITGAVQDILVKMDNVTISNNITKRADDTPVSSSALRAVNIFDSKNVNVTGNNIDLTGRSSGALYMIAVTSNDVATSTNARFHDNQCVFGNTGSSIAVEERNDFGTGKSVIQYGENMFTENVENTTTSVMNPEINTFPTDLYISISNTGTLTWFVNAQGSGIVSTVAYGGGGIYVTLKNAEVSRAEYAVTSVDSRDLNISRVSAVRQNSSIISCKFYSVSGTEINPSTLTIATNIKISILTRILYI